MTAYSLHNIYITQWSAALATLSAIFTKAEAHAKGNGIDADVEYIDARIRDDMLALPSQVHLMTGVIKLPLSLLTGNSPEWEDDLKTFADIHARIKSAQDFVNGVKPDDIDGRDDEVLKSLGPLSSLYPDGLSARALCQSFVTPNVYFHLVTAYDILRKEGVPLGKLDYLSVFLPKRE